MDDADPPLLTRRQSAQLLLGAAALGAAPDAWTGPDDGAVRVARGRIDGQLRPTGIDTRRPCFDWTLAAVQPGARQLAQRAFRIEIVATEGAPRQLHDSGVVVSGSLRYRPPQDLPMGSQRHHRWRLQVWDQDGRPAPPWTGEFFTGLLDPSDRRTGWIAAQPDGPPPERGIEGRGTVVAQADPLPRLRRRFVIATRPVLAHLCVAGLGQYQLLLDGEPLGPPGLHGAWTDYDRRVLYDTDELSRRLGPGTHWLDVRLGNGFFRVQQTPGRYSKFIGAFGQPQLWLQLRLVDADGSERVIGSDGQWQWQPSGCRLSSLYGGEDFDARLDGGDGWRPVASVAGPAGRLQASRFRPMVQQAVLAPQARRAVACDEAGALLCDFGRNHAGRPALTLRRTRAGQRVSLYPSEILGADGCIDPSTMGAGRHGIAFHYTCRGAAEERWEPQFTYTGYRYLLVEGVRGEDDRAGRDLPTLARIDSHVLQAELPTTGHFACSHPRLQAIHGLIVGALRSNMASVLTDCPHREKLGWLEQIYLNATTVLMNTDAVRLYAKMAADMRDAQLPSGMLPSTAPEFVAFVDADGRDTVYRESPEWSASLALSCWAVFRATGDPSILDDNWAAILAGIEHAQTRRNADGLLDHGLGDWYDLGPNPPGPAQLTSRAMTGSATQYLVVRTAARIARQLQRPEAERLDRMADDWKRSLVGRLYDPATARFDTGSQTAQAMALVLGLVPEADVARALAVLVDDIRARNDHVSAGDIGFHYVVRALGLHGRDDLLLAMLERDDAPSYGAQLRGGATTLTEAWDSTVKSSQNHFMLGHAEIWFYEGLGGLQLDFSGEAPDAIVLAPRPVAGVDGTSVSHEAAVGRIACSLQRAGSGWTLQAEVPVGARAAIVLPTADPAAVTEGGLPLAQAAGVSAVDVERGRVTVRVGSGRYRFGIAA